MLAQLLPPPSSPQDWALFSWAHRDQHTQIIQAIQKLGGGTLTEYVLDPIDPESFQNFLAANQQSHNDFNGVLQTQGSDLSEMDPTNANQLQAWIWLHYQEHLTAANILHLG